ncbi:TSC22 domain family protein 1 isoform X5 [Equus przewalskii]|uniref:TSC22 domain family protein 1 isoform X5 n=1 Tax=Equus przewalskii TaxID=9798 RepID=A0ABM4L1U5_EQUPR|nr:PREDICTED: TSC22 domain family protein 1 isoform X1 [Equus przewalskii]XP_023477375.1 TSC22 domain family protein 1 isoform X1 [Equus caballus]XP_023477381.1 TSC22 domain family protein 1 isoform X1 [Equus caballus]XP_023477382.1 TSC22 domain family protein 1 isoform X1 [Equus caballus]
MHQPPESTAAAAAADISARKMAHPAMFPRRGSGSGSASALSAAGTGVGSNATSSEDFPPPSLLQPPPPAASSTSGPQPPPPQSLNLLSQAQLQAQPLAPGGTQMKKKSGFQITSVTPAQISASISSNNSIAEDTESYDDLDESHTEDLSSSEILDVSLSRATDLGEPERSSSEETLNNFQEAETPGAVSPNQPHLPQPHLPHLPQQNVVINGNAHPHHLHHHHHIHHGHHLHHGHHHPSHAGVATTSIPGGPPSSPISRKLSTTGSSDSVIPAAPTSAVSSGGSPASVMTNIRAPSTTSSIGINSVTGTNTVNNVNITAVGTFNPNVTSSMLGNANINASNIPSAASVSVGPGVSSGVNVNILSGMGNGTISSSAIINSVPNAAAGMTVGSVSSQQQQPTVNTSRFRVVKLDSSSEPFKKGRWTCTEFYEKENALPATEGVINKVVETVKQNPIEVTSERESTSGSSVSSSVSTLSHYTESVGSGEMGAPTVGQQQQPTLQGVALQQMDFSSTGPQSIPAVSIPQSISQSQISQGQLPSQELSYQQKQGLQPVPLQATISAATGIQPSPVNVVGVTSALGQQPSISSLAQPQLPYSQTTPPLQAPLPGAPPQQLQYGQQQPTVSPQMAPGRGKSVTQNPTSEYVQQQPILQTAVSSGQPSSAGVGAGTTVIPMAQPQSIQLPVQPTAVQAQPAGASGQAVGQAQTAVSAVPTGSQIANIGQQASIPTAVKQPPTQVTPSVIQQGAPPSSQIVPPAQTASLHQGVQTSASSLPQQLVIAPQSTLLTVPPQPQGVESVAQGVVSQQLPAVSPLPSASSISVTNQVSSAGLSGMPSAPTNLVPPQNIAQTPATQNGNLVQSVSQPPLIASNINLPLPQQIPLSSTQFSAQSLAQAIGSQIEDARRPAEPSLVGLPQTISGDSGGMSAVSDGSSGSLAASASLFPLKVLPLTTPLVDGEDESASLLPEVQGVILEPQIQPRPRRAFDVRGPLSPLNPWRQNIQLLERVGKDKKQVGAFHYLLGFIYRLECPSIAHLILLVNSLGSYKNQVGLQSVCFSKMLTSAHSKKKD